MNRFFICALAALLALGTTTSCESDELDKIIWVSDPNEPGLPACTEWGYNSFGAYVNGETFVSERSGSNYGTTVTSTGERLSLSLGGQSVFDLGSSPVVRMVFDLPQASIDDYAALVDLNGKSFDLASSDSYVTVEVVRRNTETHNLTVSNGSIVFRRVQILYVDKVKDEAILSGTFEFDATDEDGNSYSVRKGRFDLGVSYVGSGSSYYD